MLVRAPSLLAPRRSRGGGRMEYRVSGGETRKGANIRNVNKKKNPVKVKNSMSWNLEKAFE